MKLVMVSIGTGASMGVEAVSVFGAGDSGFCTSTFSANRAVGVSTDGSGSGVSPEGGPAVTTATTMHVHKRTAPTALALHFQFQCISFYLLF
jgi:hypothetical protein